LFALLSEPLKDLFPCDIAFKLAIEHAVNPKSLALRLMIQNAFGKLVIDTPEFVYLPVIAI
jgi:hypothetical protein